MAEVYCEIEKSKACVRYLIASEGFELNLGWPYAKMISALRKNRKTEWKAREIVKRYCEHYSEYVLAGISTDLSACRLSRAREGGLKVRLRELAELLHDGLLEKDERLHTAVFNAVIISHWQAQSYKWEQYVDLWDFCALLKRNLKGVRGLGDLRTACDNLQKAIEKFVAVCDFRGPAFQHSHGLSIYFPWSRSEAAMREYSNLSLPEKTKWSAFLEVYLRKTERGPKERKGGLRRHAFPQALDQQVRTNPKLPNVRTGPLHPLRTDNLKYETLLASTMKNPPSVFYATKEELGELLLVEEREETPRDS